MCRGDAYMWGEPKTHRSRAKALDLCFTLFYLDLKVSMNKANIALGWESEFPARQSEGRYAPLGLPRGKFRLPSEGNISWVPPHVRIAAAHK